MTETPPETPAAHVQIDIDVGRMDLAAANADEAREDLATALAKVPKITTEAEREVIAAVRKRARIKRAELEDDFKPTVKALRGEAKRISDRWKAKDGPLERVQKQANRLLGDYEIKLKRLAEAEDRKRREAAQRAAEDAALARAQALEDAGHSEAAEQLLEEPLAPVVVPRAAAMKPARPVEPDYTTAEVWTYEFIDPDGFAGVRDEYLAPRHPARQKIRAEVNRLHAAAAEAVGGIRVFKKAQVRS